MHLCTACCLLCVMLWLLVLLFPAGTWLLSPLGTSALSGRSRIVTLDCLFGTCSIKRVTRCLALYWTEQHFYPLVPSPIIWHFGCLKFTKVNKCHLWERWLKRWYACIYTRVSGSFLHSGVKREPHKKNTKQINFHLNVDSIQSRFGHPRILFAPRLDCWYRVMY